MYVCVLMYMSSPQGPVNTPAQRGRSAVTLANHTGCSQHALGSLEATRGQTLQSSVLLAF